MDLFIDFSKAFDMLQYNKLYDKLSRNGIQGPILELLKNYHTNRLTTVKIQNQFSVQKSTLKGTAQRSIIGPLEYLIYVNDMCNLIKEGSVYQFADDTCLVVANKKFISAQKLLQHNFDQLCKWAHDVGLAINAQKTKIVYIHSSHNKNLSNPCIMAHNHACFHKKINCNCPTLDVVTEHTYIGLVIHSRFGWSAHVNHVCNKLRSVLGRMSILKYKLPYKTLRLLYLALADSVVNYGLSSYGRTYKTYLMDIHKLQLRLLKTIVPKNIKTKYKDNYEKLFKYCNVMSILEKVKFLMLTESNKPELLVEKTRPNYMRPRSDPCKYNYYTQV